MVKLSDIKPGDQLVLHSGEVMTVISIPDATRFVAADPSAKLPAWRLSRTVKHGAVRGLLVPIVIDSTPEVKHG